MIAPPISPRAVDAGRLAQGIAIAAAALSTGLSGMGIHDALRVVEMPEPLRIGVSAALTFMVSALIFVLMRRAGRARASYRFREVLHRPKMSVILPLVGGLAMVLVSLSTSFSAMVFLRSGATVQRAVTAQQTASITEPLAVLARTYASVAAEAAAVADLAQSQSDVESARGGTCGASGAGEGPIARMRADHARRLSEVRAHAEDLSQAASALVAQFPLARSQSDLDATFRTAQRLSLDPARARISQVARALRDGYGTEIGFDWEGETRKCPDQALASALDRLLTSADTLEHFPSTAPTLPQATLFDTFAVMIADLRGTHEGSLVGGGAVFLLLAISLAIDSVCAIGAWLAGTAVGGRLTPDERLELHRHNWVLEQFLWRFPEPQRRRRAAVEPASPTHAITVERRLGKDSEDRLEQAFFIVPEGGDGQKTRDAKYFAYCFGLKLDAARQHVPISAIPAPFAPFAERLRLASGGATSFTVFPITRQSHYDALENHKRACAIALNAAAIDTPDYGDVDDKRWIEAARKGLDGTNSDTPGNIHRLRI